jgi:hypothetical protein
MTDVLSIAVFACAVFGLTVFVTVVTPSGIGVVQTATKSVDCRMESSNAYCTLPSHRRSWPWPASH